MRAFCGEWLGTDLLYGPKDETKSILIPEDSEYNQVIKPKDVIFVVMNNGMCSTKGRYLISRVPASIRYIFF